MYVFVSLSSLRRGRSASGRSIYDQARERCQAKAAQNSHRVRRRWDLLGLHSPSEKSPTGCARAVQGRNESQIPAEHSEGARDGVRGETAGEPPRSLKGPPWAAQGHQVRTVMGWISILRRPMAVAGVCAEHAVDDGGCRWVGVER